MYLARIYRHRPSRTPAPTVRDVVPLPNPGEAVRQVPCRVHPRSCNVDVTRALGLEARRKSEVSSIRDISNAHVKHTYLLVLRKRPQSASKLCRREKNQSCVNNAFYVHGAKPTLTFIVRRRSHVICVYTFGVIT